MSASKHLRLFLVTFVIGFTGSLPIGTLNISVANFALNNDLKGAFQFSLAAVLIEVITVRVALAIFDKVAHFKKTLTVLGIVMSATILVLACITLEAAFHMRNFQNILPFVSMNAFCSGAILSLLNPLYLPFWIGWAAVLKGKEILIDNFSAYNIYILAIGAGTSCSFVLYGLFGGLLTRVFKEEHNLINWILGFTLLVTALVLAYKLMTNQFLKEKLNPLLEVNADH